MKYSKYTLLKLNYSNNPCYIRILGYSFKDNMYYTIFFTKLGAKYMSFEQYFIESHICYEV